MPKVTVTEDVNTEVRTKAKPQMESVTDSLGRIIQLRELDPLQQSRLVTAVGGENAGNQVYMNSYALPAAMVAFIDEDFFGFPQNVKQIENMLSELGAEGMAAIQMHLLEKYEKLRKEIEKQQFDAEQAAAKN
ncbi:hypothetical protein [Aquitalea sp. USM4]|uniref:hypothetical protein n=1 Tax=Aquitalea sp. USM4 TaxID=1590041 RepID=UPI001039F889|nr:hypothetical protein [Aquitalea sp. USM4]QBJ80513.1 hypothetical protein DKK66_19890 [Aquitalea sp. USM4]